MPQSRKAQKFKYLCTSKWFILLARGSFRGVKSQDVCWGTKLAILLWAGSTVSKVGAPWFSGNAETTKTHSTFSLLWWLTLFASFQTTNKCEQSKASTVVACQAQSHLHSLHIFPREILPFSEWLSDKPKSSGFAGNQITLPLGDPEMSIQATSETWGCCFLGPLGWVRQSYSFKHSNIEAWLLDT